MIFLYVGNCFVFTGNKNGQASSWHSNSSNSVLHGASSFCSFLDTRSLRCVDVDGDAFCCTVVASVCTSLALIGAAGVLVLLLVWLVCCSSFVVMELCDGAGLEIELHLAMGKWMLVSAQSYLVGGWSELSLSLVVLLLDRRELRFFGCFEWQFGQYHFPRGTCQTTHIMYTYIHQSFN